jgi:hypothetical protein
MNEKVTITRTKSFDITDAEHLRLTIAGLLKFNGLTEDYFIKDGVLYESEECGGGSHSWIDHNKIRDATPGDKVLFALIESLKTKQKSRHA